MDPELFNLRCLCIFWLPAAGWRLCPRPASYDPPPLIRVEMRHPWPACRSLSRARALCDGGYGTIMDFFSGLFATKNL